ncbi:sulfatase [bacterium]|nr:sulfatase [bacterium]
MKAIFHFPAIALLFVSLISTQVIAATQRPNIVLILVDDLRHDVFGFMGHPFIETPHIDALARGGQVFDNAFVTTSLCSPSRASFLTGRYMHNHRVVNNSDLMRAGTVTFPQLLQTSGYKTAFIGKWHMGGTSDSPRPGFDHWVSFRGQGKYFPAGQKLNINGKLLPQTGYMTDELTEHSVKWISSNDQKSPFMLYLSHKGVHGLYDPAKRHLNRYQNKPAPQQQTDAKTSTVDAEEKPMWVHDQRNSWHGVEHAYHGRSGQTIDEMYRHYCEMVLSIDDSLGKLIEQLKKSNAYENTLILFTSDGGHLWGEHGLIDKRCAYEPSIRIPLIAHWPTTITPGTRCDAIVANIDIAPTLAELAGIKSPIHADGTSFLPHLKDPATPSNRSNLLYEYYWEPAFPHTPTTFALRDQRYKLIQYHGIWDTDELYDLHRDPGETTNLILQPEHAERVTEMRVKLYDELSKTGGLLIPLGFKRNHGANRRNPNGSLRSRFPTHLSTQPEK